LLLSKKLPIIIILIVLIFYSCSEKKSDEELLKLKENFNKPSFVLSSAKSLLGENVKFAFKGKFDQDTVIEVIAGTEVTNKAEWGIDFIFLKLKNEQLTKLWDTGLLQGSFNNSLCNKIKFPSFDHELIYYNSKDYFLGSSGGEIFSYIVNFQNSKIYYAHLIIEERKPVSLYIAPNIDVPEIQNFFISIFKKDYPDLKLITQDIQLSY